MGIFGAYVFPFRFKKNKNNDGDSDISNTKTKIADIHLLKKLTTEAELSGIFNLVVKYMRRIDRNGKISVNSRSIEDRREKAELTRDPVGAFVDICKVEPIAPKSNNFVYKDTVYEYFEKFCEVRKLHVPSYGEFSETMYQEHGFKKKRNVILGKKETIWYVEVKNPTGEEEVEPEEQNNDNNDPQ
ncbi:MAG: hypothetical protein WCB31_00255 [Nitrososphaeraceae archaeon]